MACSIPQKAFCGWLHPSSHLQWWCPRLEVKILKWPSVQLKLCNKLVVINEMN